MIKNINDFIKGRFAKERTDALSAFERALMRIMPERCIKNFVRAGENGFHCCGEFYKTDDFSDINLIAFGKAAERMALALLDTLSGTVSFSNGVVVSKEFTSSDKLPRSFEKIVGGHPIPDKNSLIAGDAVLHLAEKTSRNSLTFVLISGGGSAMVESPLVPLEDLQKATKLIMERGADIKELNTVRKHLSGIKGGRLLMHLKGKVISLIISDVIGDRLDTIASGPTYFDETTFSDALNVIRKYGLENVLPRTVIDALKNKKGGETLKKGSPHLDRGKNVLAATNFDACKELNNYLKKRGYTVIYLGSSVQGEAREVAKVFGGIAEDASKGRLSVLLPVAFVFGGETTVHVRGHGIGGRNEELVLAALPFLAESNAVFASMGTDGIDGKSDACGAIADSDTLFEAKEKGADFLKSLENNDAHNFFSRVNSLIFTGNTGTNVADIAVLIVKRE